MSDIFMSRITEVVTDFVYDFIANDEAALDCFEAAARAIDDGADDLDLGGLIRGGFFELTTGSPLIGLIRRLDEHVDWRAVGQRLKQALS
jgi:hypothetical protein